MKFFHYLFGLILFVLLVAGAGFIANAAMHMELWAQALVLLQRYPLISLCASAAMLFLVVLYLMTGVKRPAREQFISFENDGGTVSISIRALVDVIVKLGDEFAAILSLNPKVCPQGDSIDVEMDVRVRSGTQLPELFRLLQNRVRESINEEMGLSEIKGIKINVREIVVPPAEKGEKKKQEEESFDWEGSIRP